MRAVGFNCSILAEEEEYNYTVTIFQDDEQQEMMPSIFLREN